MSITFNMFCCFFFRSLSFSFYIGIIEIIHIDQKSTYRRHQWRFQSIQSFKRLVTQPLFFSLSLSRSLYNSWNKWKKVFYLRMSKIELFELSIRSVQSMSRVVSAWPCQKSIYWWIREWEKNQCTCMTSFFWNWRQHR